MGLFNYLIQQSKKPKGNIGKIMLNIMNNAHKNIFKFGIENLNIKENIKILDLGFGGGKLLKILSKKYKNIELFGIDFSEDALKTASKNNQKDIKNGKIKLLQSDIEQIPYPDYFFDIITAFQTHFYWNDLENKICEIYRVLKTEGQLLVVAEKYKINYHMKGYKTKNELEELLKETGFNKIEYNETKENMYIKGIKL